MENNKSSVKTVELKEATVDNSILFKDKNSAVKVPLDDILSGKITIEEAAEINKK